MKLTNKTYDYLKWVVVVLLPALGTLIGTIGTAFNWEYTQITLVIVTAVTTFLGACIGISTANYNKVGEADEEE
ncbi:Putative phage holin Dp-1 [Streptococcus gallolyticus]|uniref:Putative phage holin Dp-1 n=2 Tax=Streptococcus gallolyticus TaxID=315405 RepID=A0A1I7JG50_9STRE|nr:phage holin [Streptococcus gallolyticus]SFC85231.1 Putative phage holin Dp-1 [Streptococcus gallolyticus]SFU84102.1 Putative phage holin Dp-1 [Streptococcus gallolyticus]